MTSAPSLAEYLEASDATYLRTTPSDLTPLLGSNGQPVKSEIDADGFFAEAFVDGSGNVIVAFEGTQPASSNTPSGSAYGAGTQAADYLISTGQVPLALTDAEAFIRTVITAAQSRGYSTSNIYVTGHSLGGAEAEAAAVSTGLAGVTLGGATFGAPGIAVAGTAPNLIDYVDYGDPVGTLGTDTEAGAIFTEPDIKHIGTVEMTGSPSNGTLLTKDAVVFKDLENGFADDLVSGSSSFASMFSASERLVKDLFGIATDLASVAINQLDYHSLTSTYAPDLGYSLDQTTGIVTKSESVGPLSVASAGTDLFASDFPYSSSTDVLASDGLLQQVTVKGTDGSTNIVTFDLTGATSLLTDNGYNASNQLMDTIQVNTDDSENDTLYNLDGGLLADQSFNYDPSGNLTSVSVAFTNGHSITLDSGTYTNLSYNSSTNTLTATLMANGISVGTLSLNASGGGTVTLLTGDALPVDAISEPFSIAGTGAMHLAVPAAGTSTLDILADYLTALGNSLTATQLAEDNYNFLTPSATPTTSSSTIVTNDPLTNGATEAIYSSTANDTTVNGSTSGAINVLRASGDIVGDTITNIQILEAGLGGVHDNLTLTAAQFNSFEYVTNGGDGFLTTLTIVGGGTVSLEGSNVIPNPDFGQGAADFQLAASGWEGTTLIGHAGLIASMYGNDTLIDGTIESAGRGVDTLTGYAGGGTQFDVNYGLAAGSVVEGFGSGNEMLASGDISGATITGVSILDMTGSIVMTGAQFNAFTAFYPGSDAQTAFITTGGTYNLEGKIANSEDWLNMTALSDSGTTLIGNDAANEVLSASQSGNDTLQAGNGANDILNAGGGNDILIAGTGNTTLNGGTGYAAYKFGPSFGQDVVYNAAAGSTVPNGEIDFTAGVNFKNLWFAQNGVDLVILVIGTSDTITVSGWFGDNAGAQVLSINDSSGNSLSNEQVSALVSAMATYQTNNPGFNAATATTAPTNSALQVATAYAWTGKTYNSITTNVDGSWSGTINDTSGGVWTSYTDNYSVASALISTVTLYGNGSTITVAYGSNGNNTYTVTGALPSGADIGAITGNNTVTLGNVTGVTITAESSVGNNTLTINDTLANNPGANWNNTLQANLSLGNNSLTVGDGSYDYLRADFSSGNNILTAGSGSHDWLDAESSQGNNSLTIGSGSSNTLDVSFSSGANTLTATTGSSDYLNAQSTTGANTLVAGNGNSMTLSAAFSAGNNILTTGNGTNDYLNVESSSGNNTLSTGNGNSDELDAVWSTGLNTFNVGGGNDLLLGGEGATTYNFGAAFEQDTLYNGRSSYGTGATATQGTINFAQGVTFNKLWFTQSGNDLVVRLLGTTDTITVKGWFSGTAGTQVQSFNLFGGLQMTAGQVAALVSAMATYQANNTGFNPATATAMPTNTALQSALATAWSQTGNSLAVHADGSATQTQTTNSGQTVSSYSAAGKLTESDLTYTNGGSVDTVYDQTGANNNTITITVTGTLPSGAVVQGSGVTITGAANSTFTVGSGTDGSSGNTVTLGDGCTATINSTNDMLNLNGANDATTVNGAYETVYQRGASGTLVLNGDSGGADVIGDGSTAYVNGAWDSVTLDGNNNGMVVDGANDTIAIIGTGNSGSLSGASDGLTINGNQTTAYLYSVGAIAIVNGANEGLLAAADNQTVYLNGTGDSVTLNGNNDGAQASAGGQTIYANGNGESITLNGANNGVLATGSGETVYINNTGDNVTLNGNNNGIVVSSSGATVGLGGAGSTLISASGATGNAYVNTNGGSNTYAFETGFGQDTIINGTGSAAKGVVDMINADANQLWFQQSGNNLLVDVLGTSSQIVLSGWYASAGDQVAQFDTADGLKLDSQIAQLVQAMATYASANPGFNPATATSMPANTALQNAIAASWHH